jgi:hypothetical protein
MACLFAGHFAGNCDAAGDTWPLIHSSDRFRIFWRPIIFGACAITARRGSGAAIPIDGSAGARSDGSAAAAVPTLAAILKDGREEENGALSPRSNSAARIEASQGAFCQRCGA